MTSDIPVTREMVDAGLKVRRDTKLFWKTDEDRMIAEFKAMYAARLIEKAEHDRDHR
jgi:hypothetical protein